MPLHGPALFLVKRYGRTVGPLYRDASTHLNRSLWILSLFNHNNTNLCSPSFSSSLMSALPLQHYSAPLNVVFHSLFPSCFFLLHLSSTLNAVFHAPIQSNILLWTDVVCFFLPSSLQSSLMHSSIHRCSMFLPPPSFNTPLCGLCCHNAIIHHPHFTITCFHSPPLYSMLTVYTSSFLTHLLSFLPALFPYQPSIVHYPSPASFSPFKTLALFLFPHSSHWWWSVKIHFEIFGKKSSFLLPSTVFLHCVKPSTKLNVVFFRIDRWNPRDIRSDELSGNISGVFPV